MTEKVCPICKIKKPVDEFGKYFSKERNKYRVQNYCFDCQKPEKTRRSKEYFLNNKEKRLQYARDYRANPKNKNKLRKLKQHFKKLYREKLQDCYLADQLAQRWRVPVKVIRSIDGLIEAKRAQIILKRTIKQKENEKQNRRPKKPLVSNNRGVTRQRESA